MNVEVRHDDLVVCLPEASGTGWGGTGPVRRASRQPAPPYVPWMSGCCWPQWWCHRSADETSVNSCGSGSCPRVPVTGNTAFPSRLKEKCRSIHDNYLSEVIFKLDDQNADRKCKMTTQIKVAHVMATWPEKHKDSRQFMKSSHRVYVWIVGV